MAGNEDLLGLGRVFEAVCGLLAVVAFLAATVGWPLVLTWLLLHFEVC